MAEDGVLSHTMACCHTLREVHAHLQRVHGMVWSTKGWDGMVSYPIPWHLPYP